LPFISRLVLPPPTLPLLPLPLLEVRLLAQMWLLALRLLPTRVLAQPPLLVEQKPLPAVRSWQPELAKLPLLVATLRLALPRVGMLLLVLRGLGRVIPAQPGLRLISRGRVPWHLWAATRLVLLMLVPRQTPGVLYLRQGLTQRPRPIRDLLVPSPASTPICPRERMAMLPRTHLSGAALWMVPAI
jgi:hypothetical protein